MLTHQQQTQRMVQFGVARHDGQPLAQNLLCLRFAPLLAPGIGEVDIGAGETRVEPDGPLVGGHRLIRTALAQAQVAEIDVGRRPVGLLCQRRLVFLHGGLAGCALAIRKLAVGHVGEDLCSLDAHATNRIGEQGRGTQHAVRHIERRQHAERRDAH